MKQYKHYSFDLWGTLIKSNPEFKATRARYFHEHFNQKEKSLEEVSAIILDVGKMCVTINERIGYNIDALEMISMILYRLEYDLTNVKFRDVISIYNVIEAQFVAFKPTLYDNGTRQALSDIRSSGATISILSNTGYITGNTLKKLLIHLGIADYMSFQVYSDDFGLSKPNHSLFTGMLQCVEKIRKFNPVTHAEIVHVGDNLFADIEGAKLAGIDSIQINSNELTIKDILA